MKCIYCGNEYSDKVAKIHMARCKAKQIEPLEKPEQIEPLEKLETDSKYSELQLRAKAAGVRSWHMKSDETLLKELEE